MLDVGAEADLYWSPLVDVHGSAGIVLRGDVLDDLRQRLSASPNLLDACWEVTKELHQNGPRALLYEEELTYLTLRGLDPGRGTRAQTILRELVGGLRRERLGLWGERAVLRLPRELFDAFDEARMLAVGVARSSGNRRIWMRLPPRTDPAAYPWLGAATGKLGRIHVGLVDGGIAFGPRPFAQSHEVAVPSGGPLDIEIEWREADQLGRRLLRVDRDLETTFAVDAEEIEIRPLGAPACRIIDTSIPGTTITTAQTIASANGRVIYLAKPASDMEQAYSRFAFELQGRGYVVVPDVTSDIPNDSTALAYIDETLAKAELSIHPLGEKGGFAPDDNALDPIVKLQLARARARAAASSADQADRAFRRIVWAPRILDAGGPPPQWSPTAIRSRFWSASTRRSRRTKSTAISLAGSSNFFSSILPKPLRGLWSKRLRRERLRFISLTMQPTKTTRCKLPKPFGTDQ